MARTQPARRTSPAPALEDSDAAWTPATRAAFRFAVIYLGLFCAATQISGSMLPNPFFSYRGLGPLPPMRELTMWVGAAVFGLEIAPNELGGAGEPAAFWVQAFWILALSLAAAIVWSLVDRKRTHHARLHAWARLFARLALAASLFEYGMTKVIPTQFPAPSLTTLVTPAGDLTLSALLWTTIGSAPGYQILTGCIEVLAGVLLIVPRTTMLGALVSLAATAHIFLLNMTFDIGVKLVSLHLVLLALFLLAPDARRLLDIFIRNRPVNAATERPLVRTRHGRRLLLGAQMAFAAYLLGMYAWFNVRFWEVGGGGAPRSALYGIWDVAQLAVDGEAGPVELNDYDRRWRRIIFDEPNVVVFQRTDDSFARYGASLDLARGVLDLTKGGSASWRARFDVEQQAPDRLVLRGEMDDRRIELRLQRRELDTFRLPASTFRWIRPHGAPRGPD